MGRQALGLLALLVATLALVAAGCGGNGEAAPPDEWADEFCTAVNDWMADLDLIGDQLGDVSSLSSDALEEAADDADSATQDFVGELRDLGAPDTESGDAIEQEVEELGDAVDTEREDILQAVEDADGLGGAAEAVGAIGASLSAMATAIQETLEAIDAADAGGEVRTALEDSEACDEVTD